ncbi:MAG: dTDP-4-dehydrorhamnose reductase [Gemmatimonadetes bacterium]|nr:dTDP-4-dehydrorhamnose reductase [Gemmatimonadota bacterium]
MTSPVPSPFLFATGIENSYPTIAGGVRIDQMDKCGHYARWEEDFELVRDLGLNALRYGPPYYRVHTAPHTYDWEVADAQMHRLRDLGITVIADLCHFGVPSWLGGFQDPAFPALFAAYAGAFAKRYPWIRHFTPVNEIFVCANFSARLGWWNECETSDAAFVRAMRNLCMANELAVEAILEERPDAIIVQGESIEHFHAAGRAAEPHAARWNALKHLSVDLTTGHELDPGMARFLNEHGVSSNDLSFFRERRAVGQRWLGVDYYQTCEHRVASTGRLTTNRAPVGFRRLVSHYHQRYGLPIFHCETNRVSSQAVGWLDEQWGDIIALRDAGIPVTGFTWYSLTDQIDWQHALRVERNDLHPVGLYDLNRRIRPVGRRYQEIIQQWRPALVEQAAHQAAGWMQRTG